MTGLAGGAGNASGEDQKKLDVVSNEIFCEVLRISGRTGVIASEEEDVPVAVEETYNGCLLYTSPSPRDMRRSRMPSSA